MLMYVLSHTNYFILTHASYICTGSRRMYCISKTHVDIYMYVLTIQRYTQTVLTI